MKIHNKLIKSKLVVGNTDLCSNFIITILTRTGLHMFLTQFLSALFLGIVSKTGGDQDDSSREDEDKVENIILEFG